MIKYHLLNIRDEADYQKMSRGDFLRKLNLAMLNALIKGPEGTVTVEFYVRKAEFDAPKVRTKLTFSFDEIVDSYAVEALKAEMADIDRERITARVALVGAKDKGEAIKELIANCEAQRRYIENMLELYHG